MDSLVLCQMLLCRGGIDMARRIKERKLKSPNITIIGEGLTERCYFKHLKSLKGYRYTCKPRNFSQQSIDDLQKQIDKVLEDDGVAVCVFDADVARDKPAERKKLEAMQKKYAGKEQVILCDSMPSIEFWFLIHTSTRINTLPLPQMSSRCCIVFYQTLASMKLISQKKSG